MLDQLRPMAVFAKTVETGSFRAAGKALKLSPSVVSHHVAQLEGRLGVALLYRSTRSLSLTPDGEKLFRAARAMLEAAEAGLDALSGQSRDPAGELRVTAPAVLAAGTLIDDIAMFSEQFPKIQLSLNFTDQRRDLIRDGIDVAIRMGWLEDSALKSKKLHEVKRKLVAAPRYVAKRKPPRRPIDLAGWEWLQLKSIHHESTFTNNRGESQRIEVTPKLLVDDAIALYRLSRAGLGLAMLPDFLAADDIERGRMIEVLPAWRLAALSIYAVWPPNAPRDGLTARFVNFLEDRVRARAKVRHRDMRSRD